MGLPAILLSSFAFPWVARPESLDASISPKGVLYYGWKIPETQSVRQRWRAIERLPLDGFAVRVALDRGAWLRGETGAANQLGWQLMGRRAFVVEEFLEAVEDLRQARWTRPIAIFLPVAFSSNVSSVNLDWFDDERWSIIENNLGVLARIGAESGARGLVFDPEHYGPQLFSYRAQSAPPNRSFDEYREAARRRGRQLMGAISRRWAAPELLSLFAYSAAIAEVKRGMIASNSEYGLLPSFYDGMIETLPDGVQLIDGYEFAYRFTRAEQFEGARRDMRERILVVSGAGSRLREKLRIGFGLWPESPGRLEQERLTLFRQALEAALVSTDRYVWVYTQKLSLLTPGEESRGYLEAIADARRRVR